MSIGRQWHIVSRSSLETEQFAERLASNLRGGEVIELVSDLGGGKTTFVRGLACGLHSPDRVSSPSFTLSNEYRGGRFTLYHFDFYRLIEPGIMKNELAEVVADPEAVIVVEWGDIVEDVLPPARLTVHLKTTNDTERAIIVECPESLQYVMEEST